MDDFINAFQEENLYEKTLIWYEHHDTGGNPFL